MCPDTTGDKLPSRFWSWTSLHIQASTAEMHNWDFWGIVFLPLELTSELESLHNNHVYEVVVVCGESQQNWWCLTTEDWKVKSTQVAMVFCNQFKILPTQIYDSFKQKISPYELFISFLMDITRHVENWNFEILHRNN